MKTYFYSVNGSRCVDQCSYLSCPSRYLSNLQQLIRLDIVCALDGSSDGTNISPEAYPRFGDIIILFAKNSEDLEDIIKARESFEGLKRILVVGETGGIDDSRYHKLGPRFITDIKRPLGELESVITRMKQQIN